MVGISKFGAGFWSLTLLWGYTNNSVEFSGSLNVS